jgi:hypothetical protein
MRDTEIEVSTQTAADPTMSIKTKTKVITVPKRKYAEKDTITEEEEEEEDQMVTKIKTKVIKNKKHKIEEEEVQTPATDSGTDTATTTEDEITKKLRSRKQVAFSKRKKSIIKKCTELHARTHAEMFIMIISEAGNVTWFATGRLASMVDDETTKKLFLSHSDQKASISPNISKYYDHND